MTARRVNWTPWLLVGPALLVLAIFFALPLLTLLSGSFERIDTGSFVITERLTLFNYRRFLFDGYYVSVLLKTLKIALLVTFTTLLTGYPLAAYLTRAGQRERAALMLLIVSPLLVSVVIRSLGWIIILGPRGLISWVLQAVGLASAPVNLIYTEVAVVIGLAHVFSPFMVLAIYAALRNIDPAVGRAAQSLGAGPIRTFWQVTFPLSIPGVASGSLIVFALSTSAFVTPTLLGGPWVKVVAYLAWEQNSTVLDWPFAGAISIILLAITVLIITVSNRLVERRWFAGSFQ
jgi:putative spermidine/putrescine transport system permease protein